MKKLSKPKTLNCRCDEQMKTELNRLATMHRTDESNIVRQALGYFLRFDGAMKLEIARIAHMQGLEEGDVMRQAVSHFIRHFNQVAQPSFGDGKK